MKTYGSKFCLAAVAAVGMLLNTGAASGTVLRQHIDPNVFFGDGLFDVATGCIPTTSGLFFLTPGSGAGDCGTVDILDILLQGNNPPAGTVRFAGPQPTNVIHNAITGLLWSDEVLVGIDSNLLTSIAHDGTFTNSSGYSLQYSAGPHVAPTDATFNPTATFLCRNTTSSLVSSFSTSWVEDEDAGNCTALFTGGPAKQFAAVVVPEPGSIALILGAFGAGWIARRKARKAA